MATSVPNGWSVEGGVVGTDFDTSTTSVSGGVAMHFPSTSSSNATLYSDWIAVPDATDKAVATFAYFINAVVRASSVAANKDIRIRYQGANADRSTTIVDTALFNGALSSANTWVTIGGNVTVAGIRWIRVAIDRPSDIDFDMYIDSLEVKQFPAGGVLTLASGTRTFPASWTAVNPSVGTVQGFGEFDAVNDIFYVHAAGRYHVHVDMSLNDAYSDGDMFGIRLNRVDYTGANLSYVYGASVSFPAAYNAATNLVGMNMSVILDFVPKELLSTSSPCGFKVEIIQYTNTGALKDYNTLTCRLARLTDR